MANGNGNQLTRLFLAAAVGVIVAGMTSWLLLGRNAITRSEAAEMIARELAAEIIQTEIDAAIERERTVAVRELARRVETLTTAVAVLNERLVRIEGK